MGSTHPTPLLHEHFQARAQETPQKTALMEGDRSITFGDLQVAAERVAGNLQARGIGAGGLVGLHLERGIDWVIAIIGVLQTNAAVVPLPPSYPLGRLKEILSFAGLNAVVDDVETPLDPSPPGKRRRLSDLRSDGGPDVGQTAPGDPTQPAFVLASSGSTGRPKMIVRSHRSFFHRLQWTWDTHPFGESDVGCQKAHMTTTHAIYELFEPLLAGAPVLMVSDAEVRNLEGFWEMVRDRGVSRLLIVPSALRASLDMPGFSAPSLEVLVLMGEYVPSRLAGQTVAVFPERTHLYSIYGSTEASSTLVCDLRERYRPGEELPLGKPISKGVQPLVLNNELEPIEVGQTGRLYMAGTALFTGYLGDEGQTASSFAQIPGRAETAYDTHDQVRLMPDGNLQFIGRVDHTVKIRGFRVDLAEVERVILLHPDVRQAAVVVKDGDAGKARLVGFFLPAAVGRSEVYQTLREHLAAYMVPSELVGLDAFPLTSSSKVDRARLLEDHGARTPGHPTDHDLSTTEVKVRAVWEETLGHAGFGREDSFFEVGGDSLSVFTLVQGLRDALGLERAHLPEQSVYSTPTIGGLATRIDRIRAGDVSTAGDRTPLLVTLRKGSDPTRSPFFVISSAGGTLGAYEKLAKSLDTSRDIIGVRDPFVWGERDPTRGFSHWVDLFLEAIRERQPRGPYFIGAYSSAGSFGYEVARRLRQGDEEVALLALVDPLAMDRRNKWRYGYWALRATYMRPSFRRLIQLLGWLRFPAVRGLRAMRGPEPSGPVETSAGKVKEIADYATRSKGHLLNFAALLELNTGLPFALTDQDFSEVSPERYLSILQERVGTLTPDMDPAVIERISVQYELQVRAQHAYELLPYEGPTLLVEPKTPYAGLLEAHLRPHLRNLQVRTVEMGPRSERTLAITRRFGGLEAHYRSMRDDTFVQGLAKELDRLLD